METVAIPYRFKPVTVRDDDGKPVKDAEGKIKKTPAKKPLTVNLPQFKTKEDIEELLNYEVDSKEFKLLLETLNKPFVEVGKTKIEEDYEAVASNGLDLELLSWSAIANIPPATRRGAAIPEEDWKAFAEDYIGVMINHGKTQEKAEMGAKLLVKKFYPVKDKKNVITGLLKNVEVWFQNSENSEEFQDIYQLLTSKADTLLAADEDVLMAAI